MWSPIPIYAFRRNTTNRDAKLLSDDAFPAGASQNLSLAVPPGPPPKKKSFSSENTKEGIDSRCQFVIVLHPSLNSRIIAATPFPLWMALRLQDGLFVSYISGLDSISSTHVYDCHKAYDLSCCRLITDHRQRSAVSTIFPRSDSIPSPSPPHASSCPLL
jgi:hypothetical protein